MNQQTRISPDKNSPRRILIVRIGAMGDVLHAMPAVTALRQRHPDWFIEWAIDPCWCELLHSAAGRKTAVERGPAMPLIDLCCPVPTRDWKRRPFSLQTLSEIRALRRKLRGEQFDLCVDMQGSIRSSLIGRMAGAMKFTGPAKPRERPARWFYGQQAKANAAHVIDQGCEILGAAVGESLTAAPVELPIDNAAEAWRDELLSRLMPGSAAPKFAVIAPSAGWGAKQWPAERYGAVATELARAGYLPLVNAVFAGDMLANAVVDASSGTAVVVPCSVGQLTALLRRASILIAGDTGPLHLAAALGRPVVALFGPTDPARNGPYGTPSRVLRHASSRKDHTRHAETEEGLMQITTDEVVAAAFDLLQSTG
ncbi:MAG: glycosyltransferase family 9 protein [Edaphobacter sp.]